MDPAVKIIILEQGNRSLEDHTRDFVHLVPHTHYPDSCLCTFYRVGLNTTIKAQLSGEGPRESIADYIEWVLASCGSSWTIDFVKEDVSPTPDPESSQPSPRHAEYEPEPTADEEPEPRTTEPEPDTSDQVREPDTTSAKVECCVEQERAMESPAHCTTAGGELEQDSGDLIDFFTELSTCYDHPPTTCAVGSPRVCQLPSASWLEDPSAPPPASESRTPPRPSDPAAPPRLSAPSSPPSPVGPPAPPGSLVPPAPPWSVVIPPSPRDSTPPALPRRSIPPALLGSSLPPAQPPSSVAPAPPRTSGSPPTPRSPEPRAPPWPSGSSVSPWIFGSSSPPRAPSPAGLPLSVGSMESPALLPPWLLPPSAPPWVIMAAFWVLLGSSCSGSLLFPPWLLPPSSCRRDLPFSEYAREFCGLAMMSGLDDSTINSLFWIGANYSRPVDLPDTTGLSWREGILRCLESVRPQSRTSPPAEQHPEPSQPTSPPPPPPTPTPTRGARAESDRVIANGSDSALRIATESEPSPSDQVREPAMWNVSVDGSVELEGAVESTAHCTTAEGEQSLDLGHLDIELDLIYFTEDIFVERDHHGCGLCSSCSGSLLCPPWLLLPSVHPGPFCLLHGSSIRRHHPGLCCPPPGSPSSARASAYTDFLLPSHVHSFVFVFSMAQGHAFRERGHTEMLVSSDNKSDGAARKGSSTTETVMLALVPSTNSKTFTAAGSM
ncbi:Opioid growth factor receptor [Labeo rohita]|uniref:Opioid growth factor receptor n=1 Tax=Labeo rohita TaxID=84645 RepID=A0ABQ8M773_LABRO|nr:Opioid growth factor receptor [Labeo rohita]